MATDLAEGSVGRPNRQRIDRILIVTISFFGFGFALQTVPAIAGQLPALRPGVAVPLLVAVYGGLAASVVTAVLHRATRVTASVVTLALLVALLTWPYSVEDPASVEGQTPWLWYLLTIGTAYCTYAAQLRVAVVYAVVTPVLFGFLRASPSGGGADPVRAVLDAVYVAIVGMVMLLLVSVLRQSADSIDRAQATATAQYEAAMRQHAGEVERVEVDALVHDNVLATLLAAASAETAAERTLVASMAERTLGVLLPDRDTVLPEGLIALELVERQVRHAAATFSADVEVDVLVEDASAAIPRAVAEASLGAAWQALTNSVQHAGPSGEVHRRVRATLSPFTLDMVVEDDGRGFRPDSVPRERLGIRLSILERVRNVGGAAEILSEPGAGTRVHILWPAPLGAEPPRRRSDQALGRGHS